MGCQPHLRCPCSWWLLNAITLLFSSAVTKHCSPMKGRHCIPDPWCIQPSLLMIDVCWLCLYFVATQWHWSSVWRELCYTVIQTRRRNILRERCSYYPGWGFIKIVYMCIVTVFKNILVSLLSIFHWNNLFYMRIWEMRKMLSVLTDKIGGPLRYGKYYGRGTR